MLSWGYNANVTALLGDTSSDRILQHAQTLVAQLEADRSVCVLLFPLISYKLSAILLLIEPGFPKINDADERPLIFICHSLGGIIVKQVLQFTSKATPQLYQTTSNLEDRL